jgi:hypothetical protein
MKLENGAQERSSTISFGAQEGDYASEFDRIRVIWHGFQDRKIVSVNARNSKLEARNSIHKWVEKLPQFDPVGTGGNDYVCNVFTVEFENTDKAFQLTWESELIEHG